MTLATTGGRVLITIAAIATLVGPVGADLNPSHVFNPEWPPHARFHSVTSLAMTVGFSLVALWLTWRRSREPHVFLLVAASVPILAWGSFFVALLVPGAGVEDHPGTLARIAGVPINVVVAAVFSLLAGLGYAIYHWGSSRTRWTPIPQSIARRGIVRDRTGGAPDARRHLVLSVLLGIVFAGSWLGYTAATAEDGRRAITDWLDPMLAGATIGTFLVAQLTLVVGWTYISGERLKQSAALALILASWVYIAGEVLSNTITVGEPPADIGSVLEIAAGAVVLLGAVGLSVAAFVRIGGGAGRWLLGGSAVLLLIGMVWWFGHPIDQSQPGAPACDSGNPIYNAFHQSCEGN